MPEKEVLRLNIAVNDVLIVAVLEGLLWRWERCGKEVGALLPQWWYWYWTVTGTGLVVVAACGSRRGGRDDRFVSPRTSRVHIWPPVAQGNGPPAGNHHRVGESR